MITARRYDTLRPVCIELEGAKIARIASAADSPDLPLVAPGLVDLQINGYAGIEFNDPQLTLDKVQQVAVA
ncbi:MAG TPA: N-acetylglucosamine-6-phosphate deacetylase, partial [Pirellulaceae bacterium]|nr:N-acetylglucosamine-6-phosphate deacetylase [Pirellulaceae bacterium]